MIEGLDAVLADFHIVPHDISIYEMAFTHASYTNEHRDCPCYDRLEFLGDSILDMIVGDMVFHHYPNSNSGTLSRTRSALVEGKTLTRLSESVFGFSSLVRYSEGEKNNVANHKHINEDVFESFIGAVYLDQGYEAARKIVVDVFTPLLDVALNLSKKRDSKGRLQELMNGVVINYVVVSQTNINREDCHFVVEARLGKDILGRGEGHNIKAAEINAASDALSKKVGK